MRDSTKPKVDPINRLDGVLSENPAAIAADYAHLQRRLDELNLASTRNMEAIDKLIRRLRPTDNPGLDREPLKLLA